MFDASIVSDIDFSSAINKCRERLVSSCEDYVSSEFSFDRVIRNKFVQFIVPLVLIFLSIVILQPKWSLVKDTTDRNYVKITIMSFSIYILALFVIVVTRSYFCSPC